MKSYVCPRYPGYSIGAKIKFENGRFSTEDPELIRLVESNDWYRVFVWPQDGKDYDQEDEGRIPPTLEEDRETAGSGEIEPGAGEVEGREESPILQELEELVRGSGIIGSEGEKKQSKARKKG